MSTANDIINLSVSIWYRYTGIWQFVSSRENYISSNIIAKIIWSLRKSSIDLQEMYLINATKIIGS